MTISFDVQLEDNISFVSCKAVGSLKYHMGSAFIAMLEMLHALHSLWVCLFPFVMLWWNVMLCATCAKYYSWNRSLLRLPTAGRRRGISQESGSFAEGLNAEESLISSHQRGSCADDARHAEKRELCIFSSYQSGSCAEALPGHDSHSGFFIQATPHQRGMRIENQQRRSPRPGPRGDVFIQAFPHHQRELRAHDPCVDVTTQDVDVTAACREESGPHLPNQLEEVVSCEANTTGTPAARAAASYASKLSSLCFLEGGEPQQVGLLKSAHWAACSSLIPHQEPLLDVCSCPWNPLEHLWLQLSLSRDGNVLHLEAPMLINDFPIIWSFRLQAPHGRSVSCVPKFICGKEYPDLAWHFVKFLTTGTKNGDCTTFQSVDDINITTNISPAIAFNGTMEDVESRIREQPSSSILSFFESRSNVAYVGYTVHGDNENCDDGSQSNYDTDDDLKDADENSGSEDLGSASLQSDDGFCDGKKVCSCYNHDDDAEGTGFKSGDGEDAGDVYGSFVHSNDDAFSFCCDVGDYGPHCVEDVDGIYGGPCYEIDGSSRGDNEFDDNVRDNGEVCGDFDFVDHNGCSGNPLEMKKLHVAYTWWDEDAVLIGKQEGEEDSMEQAWEIV